MNQISYETFSRELPNKKGCIKTLKLEINAYGITGTHAMKRLSRKLIQFASDIVEMTEEVEQFNKGAKN